MPGRFCKGAGELLSLPDQMPVKLPPERIRSAQPAAIKSNASGFRWTVSNSQSPV
jgi:hypothetical protein